MRKFSFTYYIVLVFLIACQAITVAAIRPVGQLSSTYYVNSSDGSDSNDGLSTLSPWRSISRVNSEGLLPGDSVLFKSGEIFKGRLTLLDESGMTGSPIVMGSFGEGVKPVIDGDGYLSAIRIKNSGYVHVVNLEVINERTQSQPGVNEDRRYGIYIENSFSDGTTFDHFRFSNLSFREIYPTTLLSDDDKSGVNAHAITTTGSWGDSIHLIRFRDMQIENCYFTGIGRHAVVLKAVEGLEIRENLFQHVGGAGIVIGAKCKDVLVEYNVTDHTGSSMDPRMAGRGSGIWCFNSSNLVVQFNKFMYARGIKDSYGMHIDHSNRNVVYQYNYSEGNEGGFVEILGNNVNVGYRYNLSVGDGWRKRGNVSGQLFWLSGWSGDPQNPIASDSVFIYNNSIFVPDSIQPGILIKHAERCRIYNNIIYASNGFGDVRIENNKEVNDIDHNIWYGAIPDLDTDGIPYRGEHAVTEDPLFLDLLVKDSAGFILQAGSPAFGTGKLIFSGEDETPFDGYFKHGGRDYYNLPVSQTERPNIGAFNRGTLTGPDENNVKPRAHILVYPNPASDWLHIRLNTSNAELKLVSAEGREGLTRQIYGGEASLDLSGLPAGMWFLHYRTGETAGTEKLIICK